MAVPKRKTSPMKRGFRRSADALKAPTYVEDKDSGELRRPHHVDLKTGMYRRTSGPEGEVRGLRLDRSPLDHYVRARSGSSAAASQT